MVVRETESAKDRVRVGNLVVDAHVELIRGIWLHRIGEIVVGYACDIHGSGNVWRGKQAHHCLGHRIETALRYLVVRKRLACCVAVGVDDGGGGVENRLKSAEISVAPGRRRHRSEERMAGALSRSLVIGEEEGAVFCNRPAYRSTELVQLERWDGGGGRAEKVSRIKRAVP